MVAIWVWWWGWDAVIDYNLRAGCYIVDGNRVAGSGIENIGTGTAGQASKRHLNAGQLIAARAAAACAGVIVHDFELTRHVRTLAYFDLS